MLFNKKDIVIAVLFIALVIVSYFAFKRTQIPYDAIKLLESLKDSLKQANKRLESQINSEKIKVIVLESKIDSLSKLKQTIITRYEHIEKQIDKLPVSIIASKYDSIFANNNIGK